MARFPDAGRSNKSPGRSTEQKWDSYRLQRDGFLPPLHPADPSASQPTDPVINGIIVGCASSGMVIVLLQGLFG